MGTIFDLNQFSQSVSVEAPFFLSLGILYLDFFVLSYEYLFVCFHIISRQRNESAMNEREAML